MEGLVRTETKEQIQMTPPILIAELECTDEGEEVNSNSKHIKARNEVTTQNQLFQCLQRRVMGQTNLIHSKEQDLVVQEQIRVEMRDGKP